MKTRCGIEMMRNSGSARIFRYDPGSGAVGKMKSKKDED
jgi:hypothetical protein